MELSIKHTKVFTKNYEALIDPDIRFIINQGGSRSSKTYSICQLLIWYALTHNKKTISVIRKTLPALKASVLQDFKVILDDLGLYHQVQHKKSDNSFTFPSGTCVTFFSADDPQKLRGRKHDIVFINEANELKFDDYQQINMRTTDSIIFDFNPSDPFSYIYDILKDEKAIKIHSTYLDNIFLEKEIIREIENYKNVDLSYYQIYALGLNAAGREKIFSNIEYGQAPDGLPFVYGMDFGFNDPSTIIKVSKGDGVLYIEEILYESYLTTEALIEKMNALDIDKKTRIYADSSRPDTINSIMKAGYYITKSNKKITEGLDFMKSHKIIIHPNSDSTIKEFRGYSYKKIYDKVTDVPVDHLNHSIDAARYASISFKQSFSTSFGAG